MYIILQKPFQSKRRPANKNENANANENENESANENGNNTSKVNTGRLIWAKRCLVNSFVLTILLIYIAIAFKRSKSLY